MGVVLVGDYIQIGCRVAFKIFVFFDVGSVRHFRCEVRILK